jgi:hypothetical protein
MELDTKEPFIFQLVAVLAEKWANFSREKNNTIIGN